MRQTTACIIQEIQVQCTGYSPVLFHILSVKLSIGRWISLTRGYSSVIYEDCLKEVVLSDSAIDKSLHAVEGNKQSSVHEYAWFSIRVAFWKSVSIQWELQYNER